MTPTRAPARPGEAGASPATAKDDPVSSGPGGGQRYGARRPLEMPELREVCRQLRVSILRMIHRAASGHTGSSLSCVEILVSLYCSEMRHYSFEPHWPGRDRFVLSKGHAAPALYAVLKHCGYLGRRDLDRLRQLSSVLQGHPDSRRCPGVEASTGSLGQGLSVAHGMALALRHHPERPRVYVLLGDGELQEGQVWEAAMSAAHYRTANLCAIIDHNGLQIDGRVQQIMGVAPVAEKLASFGWQAIEVDGHSLESILEALARARACVEQPTAIVAHTVKGKGVSFIEDRVEWHGKAPSESELHRALAELGDRAGSDTGTVTEIDTVAGTGAGSGAEHGACAGDAGSAGQGCRGPEQGASDAGEPVEEA